MRAASGGKFSLGSAFGRKDKHERQTSYSGSATNDFGATESSPSGGVGRNKSGIGNSDQPDSPGGQGGGGSGGVQFKKLGKTFAHNNLLPGLGNKDLKALQDVIAAEKGVLSGIEKMALETQKAATVLPNYGLQEGPDLEDVLTQSSHLLNYFASAMNVYAERQIALRGAYKKIRGREEAMLELRAYRRSVGSKAEQAERKLAKMGPENKALPGQTDTLERLRQEMRQSDADIVKEESSVGDFKRQVVKEAFMYKFSGLEELGEKLCIIGEMGKLVIEEIPLEETPVGYGRAPYGGFTKTESAVEEAGRCLSQVKFAHVEVALKPSHLPHAQHLPPGHGLANLPRQESISAVEEFAHYPGNVPSPQTPGRQPYGNSAPGAGRGYGLDDNPYGGISHRIDNNHPGLNNNNGNVYSEYGGTRDHPHPLTHQEHEGDARRQTLWQGPTEDALREQNRNSDGIQYAQDRIASMYGHANSAQGGSQLQGQTGLAVAGEGGHDYERQQQIEMDRQYQQEQAAWRDQAPSSGSVIQQESLPNPHGYHLEDDDTPIREQPGGSGSAAIPSTTLSAPWQPLNVNRSKSVTPEPRTLHDPPVNAPRIEELQRTTGVDYDAAPAPPGRAHTDNDHDGASYNTHDFALAPPPSMSQLTARAVTPGTEGFRTPAESPEEQPHSFQHSQPSVSTASAAAPVYNPATSTTTTDIRPASPAITSPTSGGKMSAGAFRKAAPRRSESAYTTNEELGADGEVRQSPARRLPVPPGGNAAAGTSGGGVPGVGAGNGWPDEKKTLALAEQERQRGLQGQVQRGAFDDAREEHEAPPVYGSSGHHDESLR